MSTDFLNGEPGTICSGSVKNEREGTDGEPHLPKEKSENNGTEKQEKA